MKRSFILGILLGASITVISFAVSKEMASSLDPVQISPQYYKVLLDNEQVRVLEYRLKPGEKEKTHSHTSGIVYSLSGGHLKTTVGDVINEVEAKTGEAHWRDPITHSLENVGNTELHAIAVELKKTCN